MIGNKDRSSDKVPQNVDPTRTVNLVTFVPETSLKMFDEEVRYRLPQIISGGQSWCRGFRRSY